MASVATTFKRLFVRNLLWSAQEAGSTLFSQLKSAAQARFQSTATGKILIATAANGHSHNWQIPNYFTPQDAAELIEELITRYEEARAALIAGGTASPTDQQIYDELMDQLQPVRSVARDFSLGRFDPECTGIVT